MSPTNLSLEYLIRKHKCIHRLCLNRKVLENNDTWIEVENRKHKKDKSAE